MSNCDNAADVKSENALSRKKRFFFVFLMALVAFVFVEAGVRFASAILPRSGPQSVEDLSIYPDKKMAKELYREQDEVVGKIELPYSGWGDREFHGKYINVDHDAVRQTWNPNSTAAKRMNIFVFGGSTAWGWGARDEYTIPSCLSKQLNEGNTGRTNYHVRNYAETSYTFMQSAVRLFALLEAGERPNYVIFYGGYNELWSVYRTGIPGVAGDEKVFTEFYEERIYPNFWEDRLVAGVTGSLKEICMSCRIALAAVRYFKPTFHRPPTYEKKGALLEPQARARLAQQTAEDYQNNFIPFLNDLARAFHFQVVIFWQPTLFTESVRIGEENLVGNVEPFSADTNAADLYREAYRLIHTDAGQNVYNISDALEGRKKECYADSAHLSEECNLTVATRMVEILRARYLNDVH